MCKKLMFLIPFVLVLGMATSAYATDVNWTNDYPWSVLWVSPWNWDPVTPYGGPTSGDTAFIRSGPVGPVIDGEATAGGVRGPAWEGGGDQEMLVIKDANLYVGGSWELRGEEEDPSIGTITMADNAKVSVGSFRNYGDRGRLVLNMSDDSQLICRNDLRFGDRGEDYTEINMSGNAYLFVEADDDRMRQNEGEFHIDVAGNAIMDVARIRARARTDNVTDTFTVRENGQVICFDDYFRFAGGTSNVVINILDNAVVDVDNYVGLGEDNDFKGEATLNMSGQLLTMGGNFRFIMDGRSSGSTTVNFTGGVINTEGELQASTDRWVVNICGDATWIIEGDVVDDILEQQAEGHWVVCAEEDCRGEISEHGKLMVDYNNVNVGKTTVWVDQDLAQAWAPSPADGATGVASTDVELCWCPGEGAFVHHLFFSDDQAAVASRDVGAYIAPIHGDLCYNVGTLMLGQTYYWAVDEQDAGITIVDGDVWQFTVEEGSALDDMEAYTSNPNLIYETWFDGCGYWDGDELISNGTGSCVSLTIEKLHSGAKAMVYTYENVYAPLYERDHNYSEARREFDPAVDLTDSGEAALVAWFCGDRDNDLTNMWILLNDNLAAAATYGDNGEDPADIQKEEWTEWNMKLSNFADGGVDLANVTSMSIGFGDKANDLPDDAVGIVWFDDIAAYPVRCVPMFTPDIFDLNEDCIVDWGDIDILSDNWLEDRR